MRLFLWCLAIAVISLAACAGAERQEAEPPQQPVQKTEKVEKEGPMITVTSSAFDPGMGIPKKYTGEGEDISPALSWSGIPEGTAELALICDDPDAPMAEPWVHWVAYGIPADQDTLPEGSAGGATEGKNSWGRVGYGGPMPPPGHGTHHYYFKVYALDQPLALEPGATKKELLRTMEGHILAQGELVAIYER